MTLGIRGPDASLLARSGDDKPQKLYKEIIKSNIIEIPH